MPHLSRPVLVNFVGAMTIAATVLLVLNQTPTGLDVPHPGTGEQARRRIETSFELNHLIACGYPVQKEPDATITGCHSTSFAVAGNNVPMATSEISTTQRVFQCLLAKVDSPGSSHDAETVETGFTLSECVSAILNPPKPLR